MPPPTLRVAVVDPDPAHLEDLLALLGPAIGIEVVGHAHDGFDLVWLSLTEQPDVVVCGLDLPGLDALSARPLVRAIAPATQVVVLTDAVGREADLRRAGVDAWVGRHDDGRLLKALEDLQREAVAG